MTLEQATINFLIESDNNYFNDDDLIPMTVYTICMDTYSGKRLYLAQTNPFVQHWKDAKTYEWQFNRQGAMEFEDEEEAIEFAKSYFKNFKKWYVYKTICYR